MPAVRIGNGWVSAEPTDTTDHMGKPVWRYAIDADGLEYEAEDLAGWGNSREMLATLLTFLGAAAEAHDYELRTGRESDNGDLFPARVMEWAHQNIDEIAMAAYELEEGA